MFKFKILDNNFKSLNLVMLQRKIKKIEEIIN